MHNNNGNNEPKKKNRKSPKVDREMVLLPINASPSIFFLVVGSFVYVHSQIWTHKKLMRLRTQCRWLRMPKPQANNLKKMFKCHK